MKKKFKNRLPRDCVVGEDLVNGTVELNLRNDVAPDEYGDVRPVLEGGDVFPASHIELFVAFLSLVKDLHLNFWSSSWSIEFSVLECQKKIKMNLTESNLKKWQV